MMEHVFKVKVLFDDDSCGDVDEFCSMIVDSLNLDYENYTFSFELVSDE